MTRRRRTFDPDFKRDAVALADSTDKSDKAIEEELGLYHGALRHWRRELEKDAETAFPGKGRLKPDQEELRQLRRELEIVRQERDILKKAVSIFSHPPRIDSHS